ncbi:uncharacterized protein ACO6RY_20059 [Pungitius sinensis]
MGGLCWGAVSLGLLLCVGNIWAQTRPDETQIAQIVNDLWNRYRPSYISRFNNQQNIFPRKSPMFSLAVSIPYNNNNNKYDVSKVTDAADNVKNKILGCDVYTSERMVAATVLKWDDVLDQCPNAQVPWQDVLVRCDGGRKPNKPPRRMTWAQVQDKCPNEVRTGRADHAEYRVLQNFNTLKEKNNNKQDFLLFYILASPCHDKCASQNHPSSILDSIKVIKKWTNYAVVFSNVFEPRGLDPIPPENLKGALERLGTQIGRQNILRCDGSVPCTRCSSGSDVTRYCYDINAPKPAPNAASTSVNVPQGAKANVPPQTGKKKSPSGSITDEDDGKGKWIPVGKKGKKGKNS